MTQENQESMVTGLTGEEYLVISMAIKKLCIDQKYDYDAVNTALKDLGIGGEMQYSATAGFLAGGWSNKIQEIKDLLDNKKEA